jgi:hypothetical protein
MMEWIVALLIAVPIALGITGVVMRFAARANRMTQRWDHYCNYRGGSDV